MLQLFNREISNPQACPSNKFDHLELADFEMRYWILHEIFILVFLLSVDCNFIFYLTLFKFCCSFHNMFAIRFIDLIDLFFANTNFQKCLCFSKFFFMHSNVLIYHLVLDEKVWVSLFVIKVIFNYFLT